jgi:hypothetical protein
MPKVLAEWHVHVTDYHALSVHDMLDVAVGLAINNLANIRPRAWAEPIRSV